MATINNVQDLIRAVNAAPDAKTIDSTVAGAKLTLSTADQATLNDAVTKRIVVLAGAATDPKDDDKIMSDVKAFKTVVLNDAQSKQIVDATNKQVVLLLTNSILDAKDVKTANSLPKVTSLKNITLTDAQQSALNAVADKQIVTLMTDQIDNATKITDIDKVMGSNVPDLTDAQKKMVMAVASASIKDLSIADINNSTKPEDVDKVVGALASLKNTNISDADNTSIKTAANKQIVNLFVNSIIPLSKDAATVDKSVATLKTLKNINLSDGDNTTINNAATARKNQL